MMETQPATSCESKLYSSEERMTVSVGDKRFTCIEYPGVVENTDKALQTLGGVKSLAKTLDDPKKRVQLRFRPTDMYSKPVHGFNQATVGLLMRVRRRKKRPTVDSTETAMVCDSTETAMVCDSQGADSVAAQDDGYEYKVEILGTVSSTVKFEGLCEYQYLPVMKKADNTYENLLEKLELKKFIPPEEFLTRDVPLFMPPVVFSRFDFPQKYGYMQEKAGTEGNEMMTADTLASGRKTRRKFTTLISFTDPTPTEPGPASVKHAENFLDTGVKEQVEELFKDHPIWSKAGLMYRLRDNPQSQRYLKEILCSVAYVFLTGPWRMFWVRFGYDPRKDPSAKKYQGVDLRHRQRNIVDESKIKTKRPNTNRVVQRKGPTQINPYNKHEAVDTQKMYPMLQPQRRDFEFHKDVLPPHRQVVYMVCCIFDKDIQEMAARNDGKETTCDERNGWCVPGFTDYARNVMARHVEKLCPETVKTSKLLSKKQSEKKKLSVQHFDEEDEEEDGNGSLDTSTFD